MPDAVRQVQMTKNGSLIGSAIKWLLSHMFFYYSTSETYSFAPSTPNDVHYRILISGIIIMTTTDSRDEEKEDVYEEGYEGENIWSLSRVLWGIIVISRIQWSVLYYFRKELCTLAFPLKCVCISNTIGLSISFWVISFATFPFFPPVHVFNSQLDLLFSLSCTRGPPLPHLIPSSMKEMKRQRVYDIHLFASLIKIVKSFLLFRGNGCGRQDPWHSFITRFKSRRWLEEDDSTLIESKKECSRGLCILRSGKLNIDEWNHKRDGSRISLILENREEKAFWSRIKKNKWDDCFYGEERDLVLVV